MDKEYKLFTKEQRLKYWEGVIAHKIRSQAEAGNDPGASLTEEFFEHCRQKDPDFDRYAKILSLKFSELKKFASKKTINESRFSLKSVTLFFALFVFFGMQIMMLFKGGAKALIFIGLIDGIMGIAYLIGLYLNKKLIRLYEELAAEKSLSFTYFKDGMPGFLYWPKIEGSYSGFETKLYLSQKWTGEWSKGLNSMGVQQLSTSSVLHLYIKKEISREKIEEIKGRLDLLNLKGDIFVEPYVLTYKRYGAINSTKMKEEFSNIYDVFSEIAGQILNP